MEQILKILCIIILSLFFLISSFGLLLYCFEKPKQKGMIILLAVFTLISIALMIIFVKVLSYEPTIIGTIKEI